MAISQAVQNVPEYSSLFYSRSVRKSRLNHRNLATDNILFNSLAFDPIVIQLGANNPGAMI